MINVAALFFLMAQNNPQGNRILRISEFQAISNKVILDQNLVVPVFNYKSLPDLFLFPKTTQSVNSKYQELVQLAKSEGKKVSLYYDLTHVGRDQSLVNISPEVLRASIASVRNPATKIDSLNFNNPIALDQISRVGSLIAESGDAIGDILVNISDRTDVWTRYDLKTRMGSVKKFGIDPIDFDSPISSSPPGREQFKLDHIEGYLKWIYDQDCVDMVSAITRITSQLDGKAGPKISLIVDGNYFRGTMPQRISMACHWTHLIDVPQIKSVSIKTSWKDNDLKKNWEDYQQTLKDLDKKLDVSIIFVDIGQPVADLLNKVPVNNYYYFSSK